MGTDSKGNQVQYELRSNSAADGKTQWSFKTSFWGMYQLDSDGPVLLLPDIDSDYLELQLYTREPYMAAADTVWVDDDFVEIGETTEEVEEVPEDTLEGENPSDAEEPVETQIIGGADAPTEVRLQDDTDQKEIPTQQIKRMKITEPKKAHMMELQVKSLQNLTGHLSVKK